MKTETPNFGQRVRALRLDRELSQEELARLAEVTTGTVHRIEAGKTEPRFATARRLAHALQVPIRELLDDSAA